MPHPVWQAVRQAASYDPPVNGARALVLAALCAVACARTTPDVRANDAEVAPAASSSAAAPVASPIPALAPSAPGVVEGGAPAPSPGDVCPKLPIDVGGTVEHQSFEGRVVLATGHDPEQGDGTYGVLVLDAPVCAAYALSPQRELLLGVLGGKAKWQALGAKWNGQRVRVTGSVRSLDIYLNPMRHLLLFVTRIDLAP
jgi:hypothetical protein